MTKAETKVRAKLPVNSLARCRGAGSARVSLRVRAAGRLAVFLAWVLSGWFLAGPAWGAGSASVVRLELHPESGQVALFHRGRALALYEFRPVPRKPCLSLLCSIEGINVLEETTTDAPFIRGLSLGFEVNGIGFSQEGDGWQKSGPEITRRVHRDDQGRPVAELSHTVFWVPTRATPATREAAWLIEERRLRFVIDEPGRETAVEWQSDFEVGPAADELAVSAPAGSGLTLRLLPDFRPCDPPTPARLDPGAAEGALEFGSSPGPWSAMMAQIAGRTLTVTCFEDPAPPARSAVRVQTEPFTMLAAVHGLESRPWTGRPGDRFRVHALVTVLSRQTADQALDARRERWLNP